jgi:hypothetical protein
LSSRRGETHRGKQWQRQSDEKARSQEKSAKSVCVHGPHYSGRFALTAEMMMNGGFEG